MMKHFVERTCTLVAERGTEAARAADPIAAQEPDSRPLKSFRDESAYVLLGPPGSGKTEAFKHEAAQHGHYITARDFIAFDPEPEWEGKTLFIDGLDEMRAGASSGRTPFDAIRAKLQRLGRPHFRLSCREADWFGANDRERLSAVAPNREVRVVRLDPLPEDAVLEILKRNHGVDEPAALVAEARERGVEDLLQNPQNLRMLAEAVAEADEWPRTRAETFDMACRKLVSEENREHQIPKSGTVDTETLLDLAGELCALLLLAGKAGVTLAGNMPDANHPRLDQIPMGDQQLLRHVVGTSLFAMPAEPAEGRLAPGHRQIAEFLAARHLAARISDGLPVRRVLSLMTGFDGGIISEFRGLAAWLATVSPAARAEIIERDPLGVVLYGDAQQFGLHEKRLIFQAVRREIKRNPWVAYHWGAAPPLRPLADRDLEEDMRQALTDPARDEAHQNFVLLIAEAIRTAAPLPELADPLIAIVRDDSWSMDTRSAALEAYIRARWGDPGVSVTLRRLLDDVYTGVVKTRHDDMLGILLAELYPDDLPVADLVGYLREPARRNLSTRYDRLWTDRLIKKSTVQQLVQLLDLLRVPMDRVQAKSRGSGADVRRMAGPPIVLLRHLLEHSPQSVPQEQLVYWLDFVAWLVLNIGGRVGDAKFFGKWLSDRPDRYKAMVKHGLSSCSREHDRSSRMRSVKQTLRYIGASPPHDYALWCADQALRADDPGVARWLVRESAEFVFYRKEPGDRQAQAVARKLHNEARLGRWFERRLGDLQEEDGLMTGGRGAPKARPARKDTRFDELRGVFKENESALRGNECRANLLHTLALAYFDGYSDVSGETPRERLQSLLGPDDDLVEAALAGLRGTIHRPDLPKWTEVAKLAAEGRIHFLAYPFMAGLEKLTRGTEEHDLRLSEAHTRLAVAIHFAVSRMRQSGNSKRPPDWLRISLERQPDVVAEVWAYCARAQLRNGARSLDDAHRLAREPGYAELARAASVSLLKTFPVRCRAGQLPILRSLLSAALAHGDRTRLLELIEAKLAFKSMNPGQRVSWLTAGLFAKPEEYGERFESYMSGRARRIGRLVEDGLPLASGDLRSATVLETLIRVIGPYTAAPPDTGGVHSVTWPIQADWTLHRFIDRLAEDASEAAGNALESLAADDRLVNRRSELLDRLHRQKSIRREASFAHPSLEQVAGVLGSDRPAHAADLAALTADRLRHLARDIRDGATSDWRQYWNVNKDNQALSPKPENGCRDALLSDLRRELAPLGIDATKEGSYADDKRADIRIASGEGGFNVPIEIKRSCHRELWSAIRTQLIARYTRDPGADGYGIYLVFWFGDAEGCRLTPRSGPKPKSPGELRRALLGTLTESERRKISVCVIDVSKITQ